jgi:hypothetical protein
MGKGHKNKNNNNNDQQKKKKIEAVENKISQNMVRHLPQLLRYFNFI